VADVLMIKQLCRRLESAARAAPAYNSKPWQQPCQGRALIVLPYISVVAEKAEHLAPIMAAMRCSVKGYHGNQEGTPLAPQVRRVTSPCVPARPSCHTITIAMAPASSAAA
jgi:hypothetical protein